jgi:UDP-N-acetylmuramoyl-tripeptide--D-alanyl-D-alanine ligase
MKARDIAKITGGKLLGGRPDAGIDVSRISTDSRSMAKGDIFLALSGPNFDGNDFVCEAFRKGSSGAIAERFDRATLSAGAGRVMIKVKSGSAALAAIAARHRAGFRIPVICVTGSNGKTTVKDMTAFALSKRFKVLKNEGTKNNRIGVPQTLLKLARSHDACVLELGTNHPGEIRALAAIARPTIAVITNVGPSHLEFLKDLDGVYREKKEILKFVDKSGTVIVNGDDAYLSKVKGSRPRVVRFGLKKSNAFNADIVSTDKDHIAFLLNGSEGIELNMLGVHNVYNALAAIAVADRLGIDHGAIKRALAAFRPAAMRLNLVSAGGIEIINDSYNSNPLSMQTAVEAMKQRPARARWVVSGDMLELGRKSAYFHSMAGRMIASAGIEGLLTFGDLSRYTLSAALGAGMDEENLWHCVTHDEIVDTLKRVVQRGDVVLVKGSRSMRMERVVESLLSGR